MVRIRQRPPGDELIGSPRGNALRVASGLRITDITIAMHERSSPRLAVFGTREGKLPMGVLRIATDVGIEGTNFLSYPGPGPLAIAREIVTFVQPLLLGADPLEIGRHWRRLCNLGHFINPITVGVVDVALWDIAGKANTSSSTPTSRSQSHKWRLGRVSASARSSRVSNGRWAPRLTRSSSTPASSELTTISSTPAPTKPPWPASARNGASRMLAALPPSITRATTRIRRRRSDTPGISEHLCGHERRNVTLVGGVGATRSTPPGSATATTYWDSIPSASRSASGP